PEDIVGIRWFTSPALTPDRTNSVVLVRGVVVYLRTKRKKLSSLTSMLLTLRTDRPRDLPSSVVRRQCLCSRGLCWLAWYKQPARRVEDDSCGRACVFLSYCWSAYEGWSLPFPTMPASSFSRGRSDRHWSNIATSATRR